jgi:hypothetical protein
MPDEVDDMPWPGEQRGVQAGPGRGTGPVQLDQMLVDRVFQGGS